MLGVWVVARSNETKTAPKPSIVYIYLYINPEEGVSRKFGTFYANLLFSFDFYHIYITLGGCSAVSGCQ